MRLLLFVVMLVTLAGMPGDAPAAQPPARVDRLPVVLVLHAPAVAEPLPALSVGAAPQLPNRAQAQARAVTIQAEQQRAMAELAALAPEATLLYQVQRVYNGLAVQVRPEDLPALAAAPWVRAVLPLTPKYLAHRTSVPLIGAPSLWPTAGPDLTGRGVTIGIIDTGIDYAHATFGGTGALEPPNFGPGRKVAGGYDFAGDAYTGFNAPTPDADPRDCNGHGTHVAGTAAGYGVTAGGATYTGGYDAVPTDLSIGPGVAPEAELYALRIFGCSASGTLLTDQAIDWAIDPNGDGDVSDRLDVINLSLGIDFGSLTDSTTLAAQRAVAAGVIVVAAATNAGDSTFAVGSPAIADGAIAVAGSADAGAQADGFHIDAPTALTGVYPGTAATFNWATLPDAQLAATLVAPLSQQDGCTAFSPADAALLNGAVALLDWGSGDCPAQTRVNNAAAAGALGVLISDSAPVLTLRPFGVMPVPTLAIPQRTGADLRAALADGPVRVTLAQRYLGNVLLVEPQREDTLYTASARGPRRGDSLLKPDLTAPAVTITSAAVGTAAGRRELSGTSMASPHVAGAAALMRQLHPAWSVEQIKALLMNSAAADLYTGFDRTGQRYGPARVGAGRLHLPAAVATETLAYSAERPGFVSAAFGTVPVITGTTTTRTQQVRVVNTGAVEQSYTLRIDPRVPSPGISFRVDPPVLSLEAGASTLISVTLEADPAQMRGPACDPTIAPTQAGSPRTCLPEVSGLLVIASDAPEAGAIRLPVHAVPHLAAATRGPASITLPATLQGEAGVLLTGPGLAAPARTSLVSVLELQVLKPRTPQRAASADLHAIGVHSDYADGDSDATQLSFGIGVHGDWSLTGLPFDTWFEVWLDVDGSGVGEDGTGSEFTLRNVAGPNGSEDVRTTVLLDRRTGRSVTTGYLNLFTPDEFDTAPFNSRVIVLGVTAEDLGLTEASPRLRYRVASYNDTTFSSSAYLPVDIGPELSVDPFRPGLRTPAAVRGPIHRDQAGRIALVVDQGALAANGTQGVLLLHHHHSGAARIEALPFTAGSLERLFLPVIGR